MSSSAGLLSHVHRRSYSAQEQLTTMTLDMVAAFQVFRLSVALISTCAVPALRLCDSRSRAEDGYRRQVQAGRRRQRLRLRVDVRARSMKLLRLWQRIMDTVSTAGGSLYNGLGCPQLVVVGSQVSVPGIVQAAPAILDSACPASSALVSSCT
jgi:hypothetical protein